LKPDGAALPRKSVGQPKNYAHSNCSGGAPTLLSLDDARTLFHEFGHALHGHLSDVTYGSLSGTRRGDNGTPVDQQMPRIESQ